MTDRLEPNAAPGGHSLLLVERILFATFVFVVVVHLGLHWGHLQGYDAKGHLEMFTTVRWLEPLPPIKSLWEAYSPPLSFLLGRVFLFVIPNHVAAIQVFNSVAMMGGIALLRLILKRLQLLHRAAGIAFLYMTAALPLFVFTSIEISLDASVFFWGMVIFWASIAMYWDPPPAEEKPVCWRRSMLLSASLAAGLLTKYNCVVFLAIPFLVIAVRQGAILFICREGATLAAIYMAALMLVSPFYYSHNYLETRELFPNQMEWIKAKELAAVLPIRDADPISFVAHMVRPIGITTSGADSSVRDSAFNMIWFQTWKRERFLGRASVVSTNISDFYATFFIFTVFAGTIVFFFGRKREQAWNDLGWVLLGLGILFFMALLEFAYTHPYYPWVVFKAKYIAPAILWVPFTFALTVDYIEQLLPPGSTRRLFVDLMCAFLSLFLCVNYLVPVY